MYSDRRGNGQQPPRKTFQTKDPGQKPPDKSPREQLRENLYRGLLSGFFVLGLLKIGGQREGAQNWLKIAWRTLWTAPKISNMFREGKRSVQDYANVSNTGMEDKREKALHMKESSSFRSYWWVLNQRSCTYWIQWEHIGSHPEVIIFYISFDIQSDRPQNDYKHSINGWSQIIAVYVEFNCTAATEGAIHVIV